ncbi:MAG: hypothetical protein N3I35_19685 [Clostridia bacterium]|nr:hypothetical protein [Clostridia bacterium]
MALISLLLRVVLISIPEQAFIVLFALGLLGKESKLLLKTNRISLVVVIICQSVLSNLIRMLGFSSSIIGPIFLFFELSLLLVVIERRNAKKILVYTFISILVIMITEYACVNIILYSTSIKISDFDSNVLLAFVATLLERSLQFLLLYLVISRKIKLTNGKEKNILEVLISSPKKRRVTTLSIILNIAFLIVTGKVFMFEKILSNLPMISAIIVCTFSLCMPFMSLILLVYFAKQNCINNDAYVNLLVWEMKCRAESILEEAKKTNNQDIRDTVNSILMSMEGT